jgi:nucleoside 2-deoxyribosyltransferase
LKIYLSGSIRGGRQFQPIYRIIHDILKEKGHIILTHHVAHENIIEIEETVSDQVIYTKDIAWLEECDGLIAEVSLPSLGVGYEIAYALNLEKPVLAIYNIDRNPISAMISGNNSPYLTLRTYKDTQDLLKCINEFLLSLKNN